MSSELVCQVCSLKCQETLHFKLHSQKCMMKQQLCSLCSKKCKDYTHLKIHFRKCKEIIEKFTSKDKCPYCMMYGHQTPAAVTCCKIYKYYENRSIVDQIKDYYGEHYDRFFGSHFE